MRLQKAFEELKNKKISSTHVYNCPNLFDENFLEN